jgi:hypothetical protein
MNLRKSNYLSNPTHLEEYQVEKKLGKNSSIMFD